MVIVKLDTPHLNVERYVPSSAYVTACVAAGWCFMSQLVSLFLENFAPTSFSAFRFQTTQALISPEGTFQPLYFSIFTLK